MRVFRRTPWLVWSCAAVLVLQMAAAFGHHHDHAPFGAHDLDPHASGHIHAHSLDADGEAGDEHEHHHDSGDSCDICLSLRLLSAGLFPALSPLIACQVQKSVGAGSFTLRLAHFRPERANQPRAPPVRPIL